MTPAELVAFMNEYLSAMTDIIESKVAMSTSISRLDRGGVRRAGRR